MKELNIAKIVFAINDNSGSLESVDDNQVEFWLSEIEADFRNVMPLELVAGEYTYKRACIEVCWPVLLDIGKYGWEAIEVVATIGGAYAAMTPFVNMLKNKKLTNPQTLRKHTITTRSIEQISTEDLKREMKRRR